MRSIINEKAFEEAIGQSLVGRGWNVKGDPANFDRSLALDKTELFKFFG